MFHLLDEDGSGTVEKDEFVKIFDVYELWRYEQVNKASMISRNKDKGDKEEKSNSSVKDKCSKVINS